MSMYVDGVFEGLGVNRETFVVFYFRKVNLKENFSNLTKKVQNASYRHCQWMEMIVMPFRNKIRKMGLTILLFRDLKGWALPSFVSAFLNVKLEQGMLFDMWCAVKKSKVHVGLFFVLDCRHQGNLKGRDWR